MTNLSLHRRSAAAVALAAALAVGCDAPDPAPVDVVEATIAGIHESIFSGATTCRMVVQAYLDRIEVYEDRINAITVVNPAALDRADELDAALAAGEEPGQLFCVPMLVKDNFDTHDLVTTGGSIALAESLPPDDAFMVRRIREEGAIVVAKTNMAEWAFSARQSVSSSFDTTRNAYALDRVPAGSSGGTASGVAASFGLIGLGSDTGNSIRGPSSRLALVGIRSTIGLTSRDGVVPLSFDRDIAGPMGRTVEDVARVFNVVSGYDAADPYTEAGRGRKEDDYTDFLDANGLQGARIGVLRALVDTEDADSAVVAVFEDALGELAGLGAEIVDPFDFDVSAQLERENMFCGRFRYDMHMYLTSLGDAAPFTDVLAVLETGQYSSYVENSLRRSEDSPLDVPPPEWDPPCPDYLEKRAAARLPGRPGCRDGPSRSRCHRLPDLAQPARPHRARPRRVQWRQLPARGAGHRDARDHRADGVHRGHPPGRAADPGRSLRRGAALPVCLCLRAGDAPPAAAAGVPGAGEPVGRRRWRAGT